MTGNQDQEDLKVVHSVLAGNRNAFRRLVEKYQPAVSSIGKRTIRAREDVKDYVQEVFLKAFSNLRQYRGTGRFYSWLMRIAYTTAVNKYQRAVPEIPTDPEILGELWYAPETRQPEELVERSMLLQSIIETIRALPGHVAIAVELFFVMNLRYAEIAEITGVPVNTLKSHVYRARTLLKRQFSDVYYGGEL